MSSGTRIGVIGAGSTFTPELIALLAGRIDSLGPIHVVMMDIDSERLQIVRGLCERILIKAGKQLAITTTDSIDDAVAGADFVLLQLRQGGIDERIADEKLGLKYDLPFTETVSVCGFSTFLRTYYEMERIADSIRRLAPRAWILNFTNPSGQVTEALARLGVERVIGVCNGSVGYLETLAEISGFPKEELFMNWRGLNHLTFIDGVFHNGENILPEILEKLNDSNRGHITVPAELVRKLGFLPHQYLQYYYLRRTIAAKLQNQEHVRSEIVKEINEDLFEMYKTIDYLPDELTKRGGARYSEVVVDIISGITGDLGTIHYAVVRNNGTLSDLPDDAYVEVPTVAHAEGLIPLQTGPLPRAARSLVIAMKDYDRLAIDGAMRRDKDLLLQSLIVHPLIASYDIAAPLLEDCLELNRDYIPAFG